MRLHEDKKLFRQAVEFTAQQLNIPAIYVEKDYWVTYALHTIFHHEVGQETVFKGGTALSKCFNLIERFSEDIDLVVLRGEGETDAQMKKKIKIVGKAVEKVMPEKQVDDITVKMGMNRKTAHTYSREFSGSYGQVRDVIIVEATWLGYYEPYTTKSISSFIYTMMKERGQEAMAEENDLLPFDVRVLEPKRTFCEKIMSLVRFSYGDDSINDLRRKIRHTYDLHQLLKDAHLKDFFGSEDFDKMLIKVANDDVASYKNNNAWLANHPNESAIFSDVDKIWSKIKTTYIGEFRNLVYGELPEEADVLRTLHRIKARMDQVVWNIELKNS